MRPSKQMFLFGFEVASAYIPVPLFLPSALNFRNGVIFKETVEFSIFISQRTVNTYPHRAPMDHNQFYCHNMVSIYKMTK